MLLTGPAHGFNCEPSVCEDSVLLNISLERVSIFGGFGVPYLTSACLPLAFFQLSATHLIVLKTFYQTFAVSYTVARGVGPSKLTQ